MNQSESRTLDTCSPIDYIPFMFDEGSVFSLIFRKDIIVRSIWIAVIVGTILNLINQGDRIFGAGDVNVLKCILTYMVPYCVATYSAVMVASKR